MARALTALLLAAAILAGCGGDDEGGGADGPISFQLFGDAEELKAYRDLVRA